MNNQPDIKSIKDMNVHKGYVFQRCYISYEMTTIDGKKRKVSNQPCASDYGIYLAEIEADKVLTFFAIDEDTRESIDLIPLLK